MDENFEQEVNLDIIADEAYFSKYHFIRLFKSAYGKTPHQYLSGVRIEEAKLLLQTGMDVSEVCYSVGFNSITSFTALFKKCTAVTPALYRKEQLVRTSEMHKVPLKFVPNCFAENWFAKK